MIAAKGGCAECPGTTEPAQCLMAALGKERNAMTNTDSIPVFSGPKPVIRQIDSSQPWTWLSKGFADLKAAPGVSFAYGALAAVSSFLLSMGIWAADLFFYLILPLMAGFMLIGPMMAVGQYETSRRLEAGEPVTLGDSIAAYRRNTGQLAAMGLVLMLFLLAWIRIATLLFALFYSQQPPSLGLENLLDTLLIQPESLSFLAVGTIIGGILAIIAFSISVVSIPMLMDRDTNVFSAIATSVTAVRENPVAMLTWGALIVLFIGAGMATAFIGLIVTLPLIGHATWHAYKDVVTFEEE